MVTSIMLFGTTNSCPHCFGSVAHSQPSTHVCIVAWGLSLKDTAGQEEQQQGTKRVVSSMLLKMETLCLPVRLSDRSMTYLGGSSIWRL